MPLPRDERACELRAQRELLSNDLVSLCKTTAEQSRLIYLLQDDLDDLRLVHDDIELREQREWEPAMLQPLTCCY